MSNQTKPRKGQLLTPIILLIMGCIMLPVSLIQQPLVVVSVMFSFAILALAIGGLYFYNKDNKKKDEVLRE